MGNQNICFICLFIQINYVWSQALIIHRKVPTKSHCHDCFREEKGIKGEVEEAESDQVTKEINYVLLFPALHVLSGQEK